MADDCCQAAGGMSQRQHTCGTYIDHLRPLLPLQSKEQVCQIGIGRAESSSQSASRWQCVIRAGKGR